MVTPIEEYKTLAKVLTIPELFFKREDLHPYGSHKGRSIPVMIDHYFNLGDRKFAISSSGNAALAAALHVTELNAAAKEKIDLDIFIGQHAAPHKVERLKELQDDHIRILVKERPIQALTQAVNEGYRSLRQSTDDIALLGYEQLASEIIEHTDTGSIFIGTSSGTTAQALAEAFVNAGTKIEVHMVQTSSCHPLAQEFESYDGPDEPSIADAIVDIAAHRKSALIPVIKKTGGRGWTVTNDEIEAALDMTFKHTDLEISPNSALSVAGLIKAISVGESFEGPAICMICGE